jgi:hypothetical protein
MNVHEIVPSTTGSLSNYVATAICFTLATIWIIVAFQSKYIFGEDTSFWLGLGWPFMLLTKYLTKKAKVVDEMELKLIPSKQ